MKTLIFNGSPRKEGNTAYLINQFSGRLNGEVKIVSSYYDNIKPCTDCRYCWQNPACSIDDGMNEIYAYIKDCDNIIIASPVYFSQLTGSLLNIMSRLQMFWAAKKFRNENLISKKKKGAVVLCGGGNGDFKSAFTTSKILLAQMNVEPKAIETVFANKTDFIDISENVTAIKNIHMLAKKINSAPL